MKLDIEIASSFQFCSAAECRAGESRKGQRIELENKESQHATWRRYARRLGGSGGRSVIRVALQWIGRKGKRARWQDKRGQTWGKKLRSIRGVCPVLKYMRYLPKVQR